MTEEQRIKYIEKRKAASNSGRNKGMPKRSIIRTKEKIKKWGL